MYSYSGLNSQKLGTALSSPCVASTVCTAANCSVFCVLGYHLVCIFVTLCVLCKVKTNDIIFNSFTYTINLVQTISTRLQAAQNGSIPPDLLSNIPVNTLKSDRPPLYL
jgi:hypothetical protein